MLETDSYSSRVCNVFTFGLSKHGKVNCEQIKKGMPELYLQMDVMYDGPTWNYITHQVLSEKTKNKQLKKNYPAGMYHSNPPTKIVKALTSMIWWIFANRNEIVHKIREGGAKEIVLPPDAKTMKLGFIKGLIRQGNDLRKMTIVGSVENDNKDHDIDVYTAAAKEFPGWIDTAIFVACEPHEGRKVADAFSDLTDIKVYLLCPKHKQYLRGQKDYMGVPYFESTNRL